MYRDNTGGIGTPTSDNERTKITEDTTRLLMIVNGYTGRQGLVNAVDHALELLARYADMKKEEVNWIV